MHFSSGTVLCLQVIRTDKERAVEFDIGRGSKVMSQIEVFERGSSCWLAAHRFQSILIATINSGISVVCLLCFPLGVVRN